MITKSLYSWLQASRTSNSHFDSFLSSLYSDCVAARDPYCAFDTVNQSCVSSSSLSTSLVQDVVNGSTAICAIGELNTPNSEYAVVAADTTEDGEGVTGSVSENNSSDGGNCEYWCVWCV